MALGRSVGRSVSIYIILQVVFIVNLFTDLDTVSLSSSLTITNQSIGAASSSKGFENVDGLLGLGPTGLTYGTLTDQPNSEIPTVSDNLLSQGKISSEVVGISFIPIASLSSRNGKLTFGGVGPSKYTRSITYTPITSISPAKYYWGIDQFITYGSSGATIPGNIAGNCRHGHDGHAHCKRRLQQIPKSHWSNDGRYDRSP